MNHQVQTENRKAKNINPYVVKYRALNKSGQPIRQVRRFFYWGVLIVLIFCGLIAKLGG